MSTLMAIGTNRTRDQVLSSLSFSDRFNIVIINRTYSQLLRVGHFSRLDGFWPIDNIGFKTVASQAIAPGLTTFEFGSNYRLDGRKYLQFAVSQPLSGSSMIGLGMISHCDKSYAARITLEETVVHQRQQ